MKPSFTPCFFSNSILVLVAHRHHRAHVDLVEGRQHGGGVLRILQAARDGLAQPRHLHALLARGVVGRRRRAHLHRGGRLRHRRRRGGGALDRGQHVALGDAAVLAGAGDGRRIDAAFGRRSCAPKARAACRRRLGRGRRRRDRLRRLAPAVGGGRSGGRLGGSCGAPAPSLIWPSSAPTATVSPSLATISASTPAAGAGTSIVTLSVSSSTSGSSTATASPGFLNHLPMVASVTDSPRVGTRISVIVSLSICSSPLP